MTIAQRIRLQREAAGLSLEQLARKTGLHRNTIHGLETGRRKNATIKTIQKIARGLGVQVSYLLGLREKTRRRRFGD